MLNNQSLQNSIPPELEEMVYKKFCVLPLRSRLVIYSKLVHGNSFRAQNNDLFDLNKRFVSKIYRSFIETLKENIDE